MTHGNWALVTGATAGIGKATLLALARAGWHVVGWGRRADRLAALAPTVNALGVQYHYQAVDVRSADAVTRAHQALPPEAQVPDLLVNNAGLARGLAPLDQGLLSDWDEMIDTNVKGLLYVTRTLAPGMRSRGRGHILNIGSIAGKEVYPNGNVYVATKHAVDALTRALRIDLVGSGVRVGAIHPGMVETEFSEVRFHGDTARAQKVYQGLRALTPEDIAEVIVWVASQPERITIADVVVLSTDQASSTVVHRQ